jgi:hypothetical protein
MTSLFKTYYIWNTSVSFVVGLNLGNTHHMHFKSYWLIT